MHGPISVENFNRVSRNHLPEYMGIVVLSVGERTLTAELEVRQQLLAPNGYLHAGTVVTLADTACGYACVANLPEGASGFTTIELKSNFLGTARDGHIDCTATAVHLGRQTQVWDATVFRREDNKPIAHFRCTQMILWPKG